MYCILDFHGSQQKCTIRHFSLMRACNLCFNSICVRWYAFAKMKSWYVLDNKPDVIRIHWEFMSEKQMAAEFFKNDWSLTVGTNSDRKKELHLPIDLCPAKWKNFFELEICRLTCSTLTHCCIFWLRLQCLSNAEAAIYSNNSNRTVHCRLLS